MSSAPDHPDHFDTYDVLIVGAGPAGLAAAYRASSTGLRVAIVDDNPNAGGQIWRREHAKPPSRDAQIWFERIRSANIHFIFGARIFQHTQPGQLLAETTSGVTQLNYANLILATGARERFLPFPGWTLPNVLGAGGLQALVKTGLSIENKKVVIAGTGPLLLAVGAYLCDRGANVLEIIEQASSRQLGPFGAAALRAGKAGQLFDLKRRLKGVSYANRSWVVAAHGEEKLTSVTIRRGGKYRQVECDYLAIGFHLVPNLELAELLGCAIENGAVSVDEVQQTSLPYVYAAGEATGIGGLELSLVEGEIAGLAAAGKRDEAKKLFGARAKGREFARILERTFALREELRELAQAETLVCRCEDVSFERLRCYESWRAAKLQTRCGMGPCQGRVCGPAVEFLFGWKVESVRPPILPVRVESLATEKHGRTRT